MLRYLHTVFDYCVDGKAIGVLHMEKLELHVILWKGKIDEAYRNKGHGSSMMKEMIERIHEQYGIYTYVKKDNVGSLRFCKRLGFKEVGESIETVYTNYDMENAVLLKIEQGLGNKKTF